MHGVECFDYAEFKDFLKTPKTAVELEQKYNMKRNVLYSIITAATFRMPLYEFKNKEGLICYGLMGGGG